MKKEKDPEWQDVMTQNGLVEFHKTGADFETYVKDQIQDIQSLSKDIGIIK